MKVIMERNAPITTNGRGRRLDVSRVVRVMPSWAAAYYWVVRQEYLF